MWDREMSEGNDMVSPDSSIAKASDALLLLQKSILNFSKLVVDNDSSSFPLAKSFHSGTFISLGVPLTIAETSL